MTKILVINSSPRKKRTHALLEEISQKLTQRGFETTFVNLGEIKLNHCKGCEVCVVKKKDCWQDDQALEILEQIANHDALIIGTPVYMFHGSSLIKTLIDRTAGWFHHPDPRVVSKPVLVVGTSAGPMMTAGFKYIQKIAIHWGMHPTGIISRLASENKPVTDKELASFLWHLENPPAQYRPNLQQLTSYQLQKATAMVFVPIDREHFIEQGWDKSLYYTNSRLGILRRLTAIISYFVLSSSLKMMARSLAKKV